MDNITNKEKEQDNVIDIVKFMEIVKEKKLVLIGIMVFCLIVSTIVAYMLPKSYQSTALVRVKTINVINENLSSQISPRTYLQLIKSNKVKENIIKTINPDEKEKQDLVKFSLEKNVEFINEKDTDLIRILINAKTPEETKFIGNTVLNGLTVAMKDLNKSQEESGISGDLAIQIIDEASLPNIDSPQKPNKKYIVIIGTICGVLLSLGYSLYIYNKRFGL